MSTIALRPYQQDALAAIAASAAAGNPAPLVAHPTGTGKTVLFAELARRRGGRTFVLAHRDELIEQAVEKLETVWPGVDIGVCKAERDECGAQVVVASVQTLSREARLGRLGTVDLLVTDEAHHAAAPSYGRIYDALTPALHLGVTATPFRNAKGDLRAVFPGGVTHSFTLLEAIRDGWLADLRALRVSTGTSLDAVGIRQGDLAPDELAAVVNTANRNELIARAYREHAADRRALAFTVNVAHAHALAAAFQAAGFAAEAVDGETPLDERRALLRRFREGTTQVVCNCGVLTEGYDEPSVTCIVLARPTASRLLFAQMVGRGTRPYPGKTDCLVLDVADATTRHHLVGLDALLGLATHRPQDGTWTAREADAEERAWGASGDSQQQGAGLHAEAVNLFQRRFVWVPVEGKGFVLNLGGDLQVWVRAQGDEALHTVTVRRGGQWEAPLTARPVGLSWALGIGEAEAERLAQEAGLGLGLALREARWRSAAPTEKQVALLRKWGLPVPRTKGEASDVISSVTAGWKPRARWGGDRGARGSW